MGESLHKKEITDTLSAMDTNRKIEARAGQLNKDESIDFEKQKQQSHLDFLVLQNKGLQGIIELRATYSRSIFKFLIFWSSGVGVVLVLQGFSISCFNLPESVLDFLVGSTTANVIALVGLVVKGLFPKDAQGNSPA